MFWNAKRGWEAYLGHFVSWKNKKKWIPQWAPWIHKKYAQMMFFSKIFIYFLCVNVYSYVTNLIRCLMLLNVLPFSGIMWLFMWRYDRILYMRDCYMYITNNIIGLYYVFPLTTSRPRTFKSFKKNNFYWSYLRIITLFCIWHK